MKILTRPNTWRKMASERRRFGPTDRPMDRLMDGLTDGPTDGRQTNGPTETIILKLTHMIYFY